MKPRSRDVTDGLEKAAARGMLRAVGMGDEDFAKPQIGVASSWNEITPCNLSLDRLAQGGQGRRARGRRLPAGVRHHLGLRRHLDGPRGHALLAGLPRGDRRLGRDRDDGRAARRLGAAGRLRQVAARDADGRGPARPGLGVPLRRVDHARPGRRPGRHDHRRVRGGRRLPRRPDQPRARSTAIERAICPGEGACGGMYTANTMASVGEALGMSLPGLGRAAGGGPAPRRVRAPVRRGGGEHAPPGHHRPRRS